MKTALTIAGSDSSGGAGIQADLKTMIVNGVYGMSVITALTAQNTMGVKQILEVDKEFIGLQLDSIFEDIFPDAIKIGMVTSIETVDIISEKLRLYKAKNIVLDPVMISTSGSKLMQEEAIKTLKEKLFTIATLITPNIFEAEALTRIKINNKNDMLNAAEILHNSYLCAVLIKGGHMSESSDDLLLYDRGIKWFESERINNPNTHGTGCTLSSAIASNLAKGLSLEESVERAKRYIVGAIKDGMNIGKGHGPLNHGYKYHK